MKYTPPEFKKSAFNCPICNAFSQMSWSRLTYLSGKDRVSSEILISRCFHCNELAYWQRSGDPTNEEGRLIIPVASTAPLPHEDLPESVLSEFNEAREVYSASPRAAAALLRLAIQKLCRELGQPGESINDDIASLVQNGLPTQIQQSLDIIRVVGNNAVHPGKLNDEDIAEVSLPMFELLNQIGEEMITKPNKLKNLYDKLPKCSREAIKKRDSK